MYDWCASFEFSYWVFIRWWLWKHIFNCRFKGFRRSE